jgi:serine/threonine protein phosphatase PrpC
MYFYTFLAETLKRFRTTGQPMPIVGDYVIHVASATDIGCHRQNNEDSLGFFTLSDPENNRAGLAVIADGMGGHKAGEVASKASVDIIGGHCVGHRFAHPQQTLANAYLEANRKIYAHAAEHYDCRGMGTTATALLITDGVGCYAHVGDSRLYRVRSRQIEQLTKDHTLVAQFLQYGMITPQEAKSHPQKNILTNALGTNPEVFVEVSDEVFTILLGDVFLLCTDGLYDKLDDEEILPLIVNNSPEEACSALINAALDRGGNDNISVIILTIQNHR